MTVLFVIATIVAFLGIDWFIQRRKERLAATTTAVPEQPKSNPVRLPAGIFFAPSHTWLNLFPSGKIRLGIDDFISRLLTRPEIVMLKRANDQVKKGERGITPIDEDHLLTMALPDPETPGNPVKLDQLKSEAKKKNEDAGEIHNCSYFEPLHMLCERMMYFCRCYQHRVEQDYKGGRRAGRYQVKGQQRNKYREEHHRQQVKAVHLKKGVPTEEKPIYRVKQRKT